MGMTLVLSSVYMWLTKVPDFPLGKRSVRGFLVVRALFGFFGLWCLYCKSYSFIQFRPPIVVTDSC
jgi:hypothetical protein